MRIQFVSVLAVVGVVSGYSYECEQAIENELRKVSRYILTSVEPKLGEFLGRLKSTADWAITTQSSAFEYMRNSQRAVYQACQYDYTWPRGDGWAKPVKDQLIAATNAAINGYKVRDEFMKLLGVGASWKSAETLQQNEEQRQELSQAMRSLIAFKKSEFEQFKSKSMFEPMMKMIDEEFWKEKIRMEKLMLNLANQRDGFQKSGACGETIKAEVEKLEAYMMTAETEVSNLLATIGTTCKSIQDTTQERVLEKLREASASVDAACKDESSPPRERDWQGDIYDRLSTLSELAKKGCKVRDEFMKLFGVGSSWS